MLRLTVRVLGLLAQAVSYALAGVFIIFVLGEFVAPHSGAPATFREWLGIGLITVACCAPVLALRKELGAAVLSLVSLALFCIVTGFAAWPVAAILALPGALHLLHALLDHPGHTMHPAA